MRLHHRRTAEERKARADARARIIVVANVRRRRLGLDPYGKRHIHQAVRVVRYRGLVSDATLLAAGFRPRAGTRL